MCSALGSQSREWYLSRDAARAAIPEERLVNPMRTRTRMDEAPNSAENLLFHRLALVEPAVVNGVGDVVLHDKSAPFPLPRRMGRATPRNSDAPSRTRVGDFDRQQEQAVCVRGSRRFSRF